MSFELAGWRLAVVSAAVVGAAFAALSSGASASVGALAAEVDPGIVDVSTNLGYQQASAAGTGIVLTSSGEVLTNNHVIRGATAIRVTDVGNGRTYSATVAGYNVSADIAVLRLKGASGLKTATIGDSSRVRRGDSVVAIGNAGGTGGTPASAAGKVLGLGRTITASDGQGDSEQLAGLIETDAALAPGDSGGPLVDSTGRVIGVLTAAAAGFRFEFQSSTGAGYVIPINRALSVVKEIDAGRASETTHIGGTPMLGVSIQQADPYGDSTQAAGAVVASVLQGSPASHAGLSFGDVITSVDGLAVSSPRALTSLLLLRSPGATVSLAWVDQYGSSHKKTVRLAVGPPQ